uniref:Receptor-binding cancer antigen expressed on SiSo cells n=1 Tax=Ciona savignyi TaxID=51511 RepID=H2YLR0_CIOSA
MNNFCLRLYLFLKNVFHAVGTCFKNIACIARRKKVLDESDPTSIIILQHPNENQQTHNIQGNNCQNYGNSSELQDWNSWNVNDFGDNDNAEKNQPEASIHKEMEDMNYFADMEPTVKMKRVLIKQRENPSSQSNRLQMNEDLDFVTSSELDEWVEDTNGWAEEDGFNIDEAKVLKEAREQRRLERQRRANEHRMNKPRIHDKLASKVS